MYGTVGPSHTVSSSRQGFVLHKQTRPWCSSIHVCEAHVRQLMSAQPLVRCVLPTSHYCLECTCIVACARMCSGSRSASCPALVPAARAVAALSSGSRHAHQRGSWPSGVSLTSSLLGEPPEGNTLRRVGAPQLHAAGIVTRHSCKNTV